mmetsp:Transcript_18431/g.55570  ORF Transcript_18431/g.55570 Transcript_18431/m.55570 type:complete len:605 (+) Transcript_18431:170-1984(+)
MADQEQQDPPVELPKVSLEILQTIRTAQQQHGLRHGDYGRYRQYCTRRLRRLYKSTKFLHGRGRFAKKALEPHMVTDARFLAIPLLSAERGWAMAMELKGQLAQGPAAPKRQHLQARLWKAAGWAEELSHLASERGDHRTGVEADAYSAWMRGSALVEKESDWDSALGALMRAKQLWGELATVGAAASQAAARAQVAEVDPAIRYCSYRLGDPDADLPAIAAGSSDLVGDKLAALAAEKHSGGAAAPDSATRFTWQGVSHALPSEASRAAVTSAADLASQLEAAPMEEGGDTAETSRQLPLLDKLASAYAAARSAASDAAAAATDNGQKAQWEALEVAVRGASIEASVRRARLQAAAADARFRHTLARSLLPASSSRPKDKARVGRPEEVVRLYDTLASLTTELSDVAAALGGVAGEALLDSTAAQAAACQAGRCYYVAHTHLAGGSAAEAEALFGRTLEHCQTASTRFKECEKVDDAAVAEVTALAAAAAAFRVAAHAAAVAASERITSGVDDLSLEGGAAATEGGGYLVDSLSAHTSFAGGPAGKDARIAPLVPPLQTIPLRPILLDTALEHVKPPALEHRLDKQPATRSLTSRLWGGWGAK